MNFTSVVLTLGPNDIECHRERKNRTKNDALSLEVYLQAVHMNKPWMEQQINIFPNVSSIREFKKSPTLCSRRPLWSD